MSAQPARPADQDWSPTINRTEGMTFTRVDKFRQVSACSGYQVVAVPDGKIWRFEAWTLADSRTLGRHLGTFAAAEDARRVCARERKKLLGQQPGPEMAAAPIQLSLAPGAQ